MEVLEEALKLNLAQQAKLLELLDTLNKLKENNLRDQERVKCEINALEEELQAPERTEEYGLNRFGMPYFTSSNGDVPRE